MPNQVCQSCSMPLRSDYDKGTNADGSKSGEYCKFCFENGKFKDEGITLEQKIEKNIVIAKQMGIDEARARDLAKMTLPNLKRWKK